ncbi:MAG: protein kinase [Bryobacteraceae bacterium]
MIGETISHYRILSKLGEGGMGVVYLAEDTKLQRQVALKFLSTDEVRPEDRERFLREARSAATIQHPNVCPIHAVEEEDGRLFFAMAYIKGRTIRQLLDNGPFPAERAVEIALQVAAGLSAAHQQGVVHRDIKSGNIILDEHGNAIILDFGLATHASAERITRSGKRVGTPAYMSPEQIQSAEVDHRTDLWSLGVLLFEMLTGRLPFREDGSFSVLFSIVQDTPPKLRQLRPDLPQELEEILSRALAKNPNERWQNAAQLASALRRLRSSLPDLDATVVVTPIATKPRRTHIFVALAGILLLLTIAVLAWRNFLTPASNLPTQKHLAVLPFTIIGNDEELRALSDGLVESVTAQLTQVEQFQSQFAVVPPSEIRSRKIESAEQARRIHGANLVITGSAQRLAKRIQITLHLIDTSTLRQINARTIDAAASQPNTLRDNAVSATLRLLDVRLSSPVPDEAPADAVARTDYLKGRGFMARMDVHGNVDKAIASFESAVRLDPNYALACAALGEAYGVKARMNNDPQLTAKAIEYARKAVALSPDSGTSLAKLGDLLIRNGKGGEGVTMLRKAQQLEPHNADVSITLGTYYMNTGKFAEAEAAFKDSIQRRPINWYGQLMLGFFLSGRGRFPEARNAYEQALKLTPDNEMVLINLSALDMRQGRFAAAEQHIRRALRFTPTARVFSALGLALYYQHKFEPAAQALEAAVERDPDRYAMWGNLGTVYRRLPNGQGRAEAAFRKAVELAEKELALRPADHRVRANLAEYSAKLSDPRKALALLQAIPQQARRPYMGRIALTYELIGMRPQAIDTIRTLLVDHNELAEIKDDPDFEKLWADPQFQAAVR